MNSIDFTALVCVSKCYIPSAEPHALQGAVQKLKNCYLAACDISAMFSRGRIMSTIFKKRMKHLCLIVLITHYVTMLYENNAKSVNATYLFRFFVIQLIVKLKKPNQDDKSSCFV